MSDKTIINNPSQGNSGGGGGWAVAVIIIVAIILFFVYGLPRIRGNGTNINIPDKIKIETTKGY